MGHRELDATSGNPLLSLRLPLSGSWEKWGGVGGGKSHHPPLALRFQESASRSRSKGQGHLLTLVGLPGRGRRCSTSPTPPAAH